MKNIILLFFLCLLSNNLCSQDESDYVYLFDDFQKGTAILKANQKSTNLFNYNIISGKMLFKYNNNILELADPESISYIQIGDRIFEHARGQNFYEKVKIGNIDLYIYHKGNLISQGANTGYGIKSQTSAVDKINTITSLEGNVHKLNVDDSFNIRRKNTHYLKIEGKFKRFNSLNSFAKLFKGQEKEIQEKLENKKLDFSKTKDVIEAIENIQ